MRPVDPKYPVTLGYRARANFDPNYIHRGVDYGCPTGTPVKAATAGTVVHAGRGGMGIAFGIHVVIKTGNVWHIYAHLSSESVTVGQKVSLGHQLGKSGATGNVRGAHLHYGEFTSYYYKADRKPQFLDDKAPSTSTDRMDPSAYFLGATGPHVTWLDERLVAHEVDITPSTTYTRADVEAVAEFQRRQGWTGPDADGFPGRQTLALLAAEPVVAPPTPAPAPPTSVKLIPRSEWTSTENGREERPLSRDKVTALTVHYPADGDVTREGISQSQVAELLRAYRLSHLGRGWADIGYNYAIDQAGRVWFLTGDTIGAHSGTAGNPTSIGVLFIIGDKEEPTEAAIAAFVAFRAAKMTRFTKATKVQGHQQVPGNSTACPGPALMRLVRGGQLTGAAAEPEAEPVDHARQVAQVRALGINQWADYGDSSYQGRLDELNEVRDAARASLVLACESGPYIDGERVNEEYGWDGNRAGDAETPKGRESFVLHSGDDVRISTAFHMDPDVYRLLDEGWWHTLKSSTHDGATWGCIQHRSSGVVFYVAVTHLVPWPIGPNDIRKWNNQRHDELAAMLERLNDKREQTKADRNLPVVPAIIGEDFNGLRTDTKFPGGDGPGRAMAEYGYADAYTLAKAKLPTGTLGRKPLIDRLGVTVEGVKVREHIILPTRKGTDHPYAVGVALDLTNAA